MTRVSKKGIGLLPKLVLGVFIPIVLAFFILGTVVFFGWTLGGVQFTSLRDVGSGALKELSALAVKGSETSSNIQDFSKPSGAIEERVREIERRFAGEFNKKFRIFTVVIIAVFIVLLGVIYLYSRSVIRPILHLAQVADRIGMGELDTPIEIETKGELAVLGESIERMRESVKAAVERLQKRKEK